MSDVVETDAAAVWRGLGYVDDPDTRDYAGHAGGHAFARILAELQQVKDELEDAQVWFKRERQDAAELRIENERYREALREAADLVKDWNHPNAERLSAVVDLTLYEPPQAAPTTQEDRHA